MYNLDSNHKAIITAAQTLGIIVVDNAKVKRYEPGQLDTWWGFPNPYGGPGLWVWVEIKTETGTLNPPQQRNIADCNEAGLPVEVIRTTEDIERVYVKYLARMRGGNV